MEREEIENLIKNKLVIRNYFNLKDSIPIAEVSVLQQILREIVKKLPKDE